MCGLASVCLSDLGWNPLQAPLVAVTEALWHTREVEPVLAGYLCLPVGLLQKPFPQDLWADLPSTVFSQIMLVSTLSSGDSFTLPLTLQTVTPFTFQSTCHVKHIQFQTVLICL